MAALTWLGGLRVPRNQWPVPSETSVPGRVTQDGEATEGANWLGRMIRKRLGVITVAITIIPVIILIVLKNPDLSKERKLVERMGYLEERLEHAEMLNRDRLSDVINLSRKLKLLLRTNNVSSIPLSDESRNLLGNISLSTDLHLPSIYSFMPHLHRTFNATVPAFKLSKGRTSVDVILGVPTVKREVQSYLMTTLRNLIDNIHADDLSKCLIVVYVGETDLDYVNVVASQVERKFQEHVDSGLIEIISPAAAFYPDFNKLRLTLGDPIERVRWRTKQNLDFAFLMMYAQPKGIYYVQLEDDIQAKKDFLKTMTNFAHKNSAQKKDWIVLDFCQLGFIGKMLKCSHLPYLIQFFAMFYNDKPVDWLLDYMVQTKVCNLDKDLKTCKKAKDAVWIHSRPSIFQHIGTHSSLKGKVQKLKDKQFGKVQLHFPHDNPETKVQTNVKAYKTYTLERAYKGETYFWGLLPQAGDTISFNFDPPILLASYLFRSGNVEHPSDKLYNTTVEVLPATPHQSAPSLKKTDDGYFIVGVFDDMGVAEGEIHPSLGNIKTLRLSIHAESENWAIINEIFIKPLSR